MPDERGGLLLGRRLRLELEAVLGGQVVERVLGARGLDQVRGEQRVVVGLDPLRLGVVDDERSVRARPKRGDTTTTSSLANATRSPSLA